MWQPYCNTHTQKEYRIEILMTNQYETTKNLKEKTNLRNKRLTISINKTTRTRQLSYVDI